MKRIPGFIFSALAILGGLGLLYEGFVSLILYRLVQKPLTLEAATIGIIGGADGPTAVFVTSAPSAIPEVVVFGILLVAGIAGLFFLKKFRKS